MNNVFVYCEIEEGTVADVSQELLTKGRALADKLNCRLEAVAAGMRAGATAVLTPGAASSYAALPQITEG